MKLTLLLAVLFAQTIAGAHPTTAGDLRRALFLQLGLPFPGPGARTYSSSGPSLVSSSKVACASATTCVINIPASTAGDTLSGMFCSLGANISAIVDSQGQSWSYIDGAGINCPTAYFQNSVAGVTQVTATWGTPATSVAIVHELGGVSTTAALDVHAALPVTPTASPWQSDPVTTTAANEILMGFAINIGTGLTFGATGGWTAGQTQEQSTPTGFTIFSEYQIVSSTQTGIRATGTVSSGNTYATIATFK